MSETTTATKRVLLAGTRGYCAGVDRAVLAVEKALEKHGPPVYVRRQIVHNTHVVDALRERGAVFVDEADQVPEASVVVFSAHGVSPQVHNAAAERELSVIDATCPLVTKVHTEARRFARDGYEILLIGHNGHEEVEGTSGEAPEHTRVVDSIETADKVEVSDPNRVVWLSQTTLSVTETMDIVRRLRRKFPNLHDPPSDDICYATQNRQDSVTHLAPECDLVLVIGSDTSSNAHRLVEVALAHGAGAAFLLDTAADLDDTRLPQAGTVGVTSAASTPEILVDEVLAHLADRGWTDVDEVHTITENQHFALPRSLRTAPAPSSRQT